MTDMRFNMVAGGVLAAGLSVMALNVVSEQLFHPHYPEQLAVDVAVASTESAGAGAAEAAVETRPDFGRVFADEAQLTSLVAQGEKVAKVCASCHSFTPGGANGQGPAMYGVFGRTAGAHAGFSYSAAMREYAKPWSYDNLYDYLKNPKGYVPGTIMAFAGLRKPEDRQAIVAYLRSLSPSPAPLPPPLPEAPAPEAAGEAMVENTAPQTTPVGTDQPTPNAPPISEIQPNAGEGGSPVMPGSPGGAP